MAGKDRGSNIAGPLASGMGAAALVILTVVVAVFLGSREGSLLTERTATDTASPPAPTATPSPTATATATAAPTASASPTPALSPTAACPPPAGWTAYVVQPGETLTALAWRFWTTEYALMQANCLSSRLLQAGQILYVPNVTPRPPCGRPPGWVPYVVRRGDTLYSLAARYGITVAALKQANCLQGDTIVVGATLWVPYYQPQPTRRPTATRPPATATPTLTPTPLITASATVEPTVSVEPTETATGAPPTETATPGGPSATPTLTSEPGGTPTETAPPTESPIPPTETPAPTDTPLPPTATQPPTDTPLPPTATPPPTETPIPPTATP
ncbi:MAG TPA: LysM peptidoglycan-binding domain-containing protein [Anaerolineae bacterium]|nr:LysM peptidoglycan-binding domain-containing protein [Anaerolineae bacterium]